MQKKGFRGPCGGGGRGDRGGPETGVFLIS